MNTNVRFEGSEEELRALAPTLYQMMEVVINTEENLREIIQYGEPGPGGRGFVPTDKDHFDKVIAFEAGGGVEVGHNKRGKRLHVHADLKIKHTTLIRIDPVKLKRLANEVLADLGFPWPIQHVNIKFHGVTPSEYINWDKDAQGTTGTEGDEEE